MHAFFQLHPLLPISIINKTFNLIHQWNVAKKLDVSPHQVILPVARRNPLLRGQIKLNFNRSLNLTTQYAGIGGSFRQNDQSFQGLLKQSCDRWSSSNRAPSSSMHTHNLLVEGDALNILQALQPERTFSWGTNGYMEENPNSAPKISRMDSPFLWKVCQRAGKCFGKISTTHSNYLWDRSSPLSLSCLSLPRHVGIQDQFRE